MGRSIDQCGSFCYHSRAEALAASASKSQHQAMRFIVANSLIVCHKPDLRRPADQGLPCRCSCGLFRFRKNLSTFNALTSILAAKAPLGRVFAAATGEPNAQAEDQVRR